MLLESIKLENFRQFIDEFVTFATGEDGKNVTIIIGENGTGKTTFAQAFFWCMYGTTDFSDKLLLNRTVANNMQPGDKANVAVELKLRQGEVSYTLTRKQEYKKESSGKITVQNTVLDIAKKGTSGNTEYVKKTMTEAEIESILPKELSKYFFFDGERIEKMSKDISSDSKSSDFADAVKGILGLNGMLSAIDHLNPHKKNSVIGSYESSYDSGSDAKIKEYTQTIERCNSDIENISARISELENAINAAEVRRKEKSEEIKQYEDGQRLQETREKLLKEIDATNKMKSETYKWCSNEFNDKSMAFFSANLIKRALKFLEDQDFTGRDIPYMHEKTIDYLLNQGTCICGTCLQEGTLPYQKVCELKEFLPPKSLSSAVSDFKQQALSRAKNLVSLQEDLEEEFSLLSQQNDDISEMQDELKAIDKKLSGDNIQEKVQAINKEIQRCSQIIEKDNSELIQNIADKKVAEREKEKADTQRRELNLLNEKNRKIEEYKECAYKIYQELSNTYAESEERIRHQLQETINDIFKQLFAGDLSLTINSRYHISVHVNNYEGDVETSTAQSISVIFAFISAIIKMAKENSSSTENGSQLLTSEPYPLVMDAPLSTFDKKRIKAVCEAIPEVAEQVVIFIKDLDGELAETYMGDKIGSLHHFEKKNDFETTIV